MIEDARDELATAAEVHDLVGYREPVSEFRLPAFVVLDPDEVNYHPTWSGTETLLRGRVIVPFTVDGETGRTLDRLLAADELPRTLTQHDTEVWDELAVVRALGPYVTYVNDDGDLVGISADLEITIKQ